MRQLIRDDDLLTGGAGIATSAFLFAVFHLSPIVLVPVGLVGAYLALLVWRSDSLYPSILAHALNNSVALFILPFFIDEELYERYASLIFVIAGATFLALVRLYLQNTDPPSAATAARGPGGLEGLEIDGRLGDSQQPEDPEQPE